MSDVKQAIIVLADFMRDLIAEELRITTCYLERVEDKAEKSVMQDRLMQRTYDLERLCVNSWKERRAAL